MGEKVRFYYGQANDESWIHIIGGHFDTVYVGGSFHPDSDREYRIETTAVAAGSGKSQADQATEKGQAVQIVVEGEENLDIMRVISPPSEFN